MTRASDWANCSSRPCRKTRHLAPAAMDKALAAPLRAPLLLVVIASPKEHAKVPRSEQVLSAGCAAHALLQAAHAQGLGAIWRTGELAYHPTVAKGLGLSAGEQVIAFIYLGTPEVRCASRRCSHRPISSSPGRADQRGRGQVRDKTAVDMVEQLQVATVARSALRRTMASPRPCPLPLCCGARKKGSPRRARCSSATPGPWSRISTCQASACAVTRISTDCPGG